MRVAIIALAVGGLALSGCSSLGGGSAATSQILDNLRHCKRTYIGGVGGVIAPNASVFIECPAEPFGPEAEKSVPAKPATPTP